MSAIELKALESFSRQFKSHCYKKGQILINEDDDPEIIFYLLKGYVRKYYLFESGNELTLGLVSPFSYFPLTLAVGEKISPFCYEAMTDCFVVRIPKLKLLNYMKDKQSLRIELMSRLLGLYSEHLDRLEELVFGSSYQKVTSVILYLAKHFGLKSRNKIIIPLKFTHQDIATLAGITRETASISMKRLKDKKIVYYYTGIITITNISALRRGILLEKINTRMDS